ncbi:MAG: flippase-like domain-containing protein [Myxococcales bacterium]|nr:flippase-like domain-containing protein [Myxococcales bacterium]
MTQGAKGAEAAKGDEARAETDRSLLLHGIFRKVLLGTLLGVLVFAALSAYADVRALGEGMGRYDFRAFGLALLLATGNYAIRFLRWHYYLGVVRIPVPRLESLLVFVAGFIMSVTPGKLGEVFKSVLLHESRGAPMERTAPIVIAERLTDLFALVLLVALGALVLEQGLPIALLGGAAVLLAWAAAAYRPFGQRILELLARLPLLRRIAPRLAQAYEALRELVAPAPLALGTGLALLGWALECAALYVLVRGFEGLSLGPLEAAFAYAAPTVAGALAMLPGGLGVTEAGMTGALRSLGGPLMTPSAATLITVLVRLATLWWAVLLGALGLLALRRRRAASGAE